MDVRHSVMLLGPGGCGKTTIWKTLQATKNIGHEKKRVCVSDIINPKAITVNEMYGYMIGKGLERWDFVNYYAWYGKK